jgi:hypothetical protein
LDEVDILFIDREVCEVHEFLNLSEALLGVDGGLVFAGCKTSQAFFINVKTQWVNACDRDVDAQVKFKSVKKEGVLDVLAAYELFLTFRLGNLRHLVCYNNASTLATGRWLENPHFLRLPPHIILQIHQFIWKNVCFRYETKMLGPVDFSYFAYISEHKVFPSDVIGVREVIHFLVPFESLKKRGFYCSYLPEESPFFLLGFLGVKSFYISEAIILEGVSDDFDVVVLELKVVAAVGRLVRSDRHRVFIRPELKIITPLVILQEGFHSLLRF